MIISFAWTTPALLAGAKTMTRREWNAAYAARFKVGQLVDAWDHSPRTRPTTGAHKIATIRITKAPYLEDTVVLGPEDYRREGFEWLTNRGARADRDRVLAIWSAWLSEPVRLWVVEFELVEAIAS